MPRMWLALDSWNSQFASTRSGCCSWFRCFGMLAYYPGKRLENEKEANLFLQGDVANWDWIVMIVAARTRAGIS